MCRWCLSDALDFIKMIYKYINLCKLENYINESNLERNKKFSGTTGMYG
jgi:hypothetical protein